jgi:hypothetical protein
MGDPLNPQLSLAAHFVGGFPEALPKEPFKIPPPD